MIRYDAFDSAIGLNWYDADRNLQQIMQRVLDPTDLEWCEPELVKIGALCGGPIAARAEVTDKHPPELVKFDRWGEPLDTIVHHPGALATKRDVWEAGISGPRLRQEAARRGRRYPAAMVTALNYLLSQAETGMLCAVGMTNGVIGLVQRFAAPAVQDVFLPRLTAADFDDAWDGAMFMTEKTGGSDLSTITTTARQDGERWLLNGPKWFCSNVDAGAIATLARPEGAADGLKGVALFLVPKYRRDGSRNGISIRRLKDKLGTRAVPTAEVDFVDAEAFLLAGGGHATDGRGINRMMEMVTDSRHGIAVMGLGIMRRSFLEAAIFAAHRSAFGRRIEELPLVRETLVSMVVELEAAAALVFAATAEDTALSRLLVPVAKLRATRRGVELASQAVEIHGGNGYIENWPVARQLRDAQCHTIWEGTENIICLDILRAFRNEQVLGAAFSALEGRARSTSPLLDSVRQSVMLGVNEVREALAFLSGADRDLVQLRARSFGNYLADVVQGALLLTEAEWELRHRGSARKALVAHLFAEAHLRQPAVRGITSGARIALDFFSPLTRYEDIEPARVEATLRAGALGARAQVPA
jgi:alkylation response protein AidB-like acyl-CoA dehydrogenase